MERDLTEFYRKYRQRLYNRSFRILGNVMDAEDVVQDVIIRYFRFNTEKMTPEQTEAWLMKTCTRASIDQLRKRVSMMKLYRQQEAAELEESSASDELEDRWNRIEVNIEKNRLITMIKNVLSELPDGYRSILSMVLFEGYDYQETAQVFGLSESTVRSQYLRGKRKLIESLEQLLNQ